MSKLVMGCCSFFGYFAAFQTYGQTASVAEFHRQCIPSNIKGRCTAHVEIDRETGNYRVQSSHDGCNSIDVSIDNSVYPHRFYGATVEDDVMILHKDRDYSVSVVDCRIMESIDEAGERCNFALSEYKRYYDGSANRKCDFSTEEEKSACAASIYQEASRLADQAVSQFNQCAGFPVLRLESVTAPLGIGYSKVGVNDQFK